jgi:hypothetical protein
VAVANEIRFSKKTGLIEKDCSNQILIFEFENGISNSILAIYSNGIFKKNNPLTMSPRPIYWFGSLNRSPSMTYAANDSINAETPSHAAFTIMTLDPFNDEMRKKITPAYPKIPSYTLRRANKSL